MKNKIFQSRDLCLRALDTNSACAKSARRNEKKMKRTIKTLIGLLLAFLVPVCLLHIFLPHKPLLPDIKQMMTGRVDQQKEEGRKPEQDQQTDEEAGQQTDAESATGTQPGTKQDFVTEESAGMQQDLETEKEAEVSQEQIDFYMSLEPECSFLREDGMELRLVPVDRACGSSYYVLIGVENGECSFVNSDPFLGSGGQALFIYFVDNEVGYLAKSYSGGSLGELFVTEDGGKSFQNINIEEPQVKLSDHTSYCPFVMPEEIYQQDNEIYLVMGQGPDGDYHGEAGYSCGVYQADKRSPEKFSFEKEIPDKSHTDCMNLQ